jgi:acyl-coenzyme A synthetase/AMP-(fatty) acid ligase
MPNGDSFPLTDRCPDETLAFNADGPVRVAQFVEQATRLASRLPAHRYVINLLSDRYQYLLGFSAATLAGQCTLMPPNRLPRTLEQLKQEYPDCHVLGEDGQPIDGPPCPAGPALHDVPEIAAGQLCAIAFTSGSTGSPKANAKHWRTLRTGTRCNAELLLDRSVRQLNLLATVPPQHMWGMEMSILLPLFAKVAVSHRTPFFPQDIADALAELPEPRALISSPVHLEALVKSGVVLADVSAIFTATAPLSVELAGALEERFNTEVTDVFGCSETGVLAARRTSRNANWRLSNGFRMVTGPDGTLVYGSHLPEDITIPDIIEIGSGNEFRWLGRHQDMINIAGKRGSLAELNQCLNAMPGVNDGVIFMPESNDRLAAMVVAPGLSAEEIRAYLGARVEAVFLPRPICLVTALPRQETGKLARKTILQMFERLGRARKPPGMSSSGSGM